MDQAAQRENEERTRKEVSLTITDAYRERFPDLSFGIGTIQGCTYFEGSEVFKRHKREFLRKIRRRANLAQVTERIDLYDHFFRAWGYFCPLPGHLRKVIDMGFPIVNLYIDTHIMAETGHGILMAIQDLEGFRGPWRLDLARDGEAFEGVSGRQIVCKEGEIVLRDDSGIVCSLFQGPDSRTRVGETTKDIVVYVFTAPGIPEGPVIEGIKTALQILEEFGKGKDPWWRIFKP